MTEPKPTELVQQRAVNDAEQLAELGHVQEQGTVNDAERLAQLGHVQELDRRFSLPALAALCLCLMAT